MEVFPMIEIFTHFGQNLGICPLGLAYGNHIPSTISNYQTKIMSLENW
jgi:hypothetical protein